VKLKVHGSSFLARMALTYHEESGVSDVSDVNASRMLAACLQQVARVGLVEFEERHDTRTNGQHYTPQQTAAADQPGKRMMAS